MPTSCTNINSSSQIIENSEGSISVFIENGGGIFIPYVLNKACCLSLNSGYTYDENTQSCRWSPLKACNIQNTFKITLNSEGNDGTYFYMDANEKCSLNVSFDYLFKINCSSLPIPQISPIITPILGFPSGSVKTGIEEDVRSLPIILPISGFTCANPIDFFESLDVSMTIDIITSGGSTETVYQLDFFPFIGSGNLYEYLVSAQTDSGFYVTGFPPELFTINDCKSSITTIPTYNSCQTVLNMLINELYQESGLSGTTGFSGFSSSISQSAFTSNWLHYATTISDPTLLGLIANKKVKISIVINHTCGDICILLDNIVIEKNCEVIDKQTIFVTQCPGFDLELVRDNKKSWINNIIPINRNFNIFDVNGSNSIRQTAYDVNDERLIINTKQIDLDINIAAAIETDVWCYLSNNPCLFTGITHCYPCNDYKQFEDGIYFNFMDGYVYEFEDEGILSISASTCCGDNMIMFNELITQPLSAITTVEDFEYFMSSELIDAKNRQTISGYATLRALYERYLSSIGYCGTYSAAFNYLSMDQFAGLLDNYWFDIVEQVVPSTTIWGAVKIYANTIFDAQKYKYKAYTSLFCNNPFYGNNVLSPIYEPTGLCQTVNVIMTDLDITTDPQACMTTNSTTNVSTCNTICVAQMNAGSEFIGGVNIFGASCLSGATISSCDLGVTISTEGLTATGYVSNAKAPIYYEWSNGDVNAATTLSGNGMYSLTVIDANCCSATTILDFVEPIVACWYNMLECPRYVHEYLNCNPYIPFGDYGPYTAITISATSMIINGIEYISGSPITTIIDNSNINIETASVNYVDICGVSSAFTYTNFVDFINSIFINNNIGNYKAQMSYNSIMANNAVGPVYDVGFYIIRPQFDTFSIKVQDNAFGFNLNYTQDSLLDWNGMPVKYIGMTCDNIKLIDYEVIENGG